MSLEHLARLLDEGRRVSFFLSPDSDRGKYVCDVGSKDEEHFVFANSVEGLVMKLERREMSKGPCPCE